MSDKTRRDLPAGRPERGTAAWHNDLPGMISQDADNYRPEPRLSERTDLRPMAMCARDVRPGMVVLEGLPAREETVRGPLSVPGYWELDVLAEQVLASELAAGDVVRLPSGYWVPWGSVEHYNGETAVRAYIDPAWERTQAEAECPAASPGLRGVPHNFGGPPDSPQVCGRCGAPR